MTIKTSVLIKFKSMEDLENNNWIILDSLGNIFELYANVTVMTTLLNLNTLWITQAELCLKGTFVKPVSCLLQFF